MSPCLGESKWGILLKYYSHCLFIFINVIKTQCDNIFDLFCQILLQYLLLFSQHFSDNFIIVSQFALDDARQEEQYPAKMFAEIYEDSQKSKSRYIFFVLYLYYFVIKLKRIHEKSNCQKIKNEIMFDLTL